MTNHLNAADLMEKIMEDGIYPKLKNLESRDKTIKKSLRKRLMDSEVKRHEFRKHGLVAKFVPKRIMETDYEGLNEYLMDLGLLLPVVKLDHKRIKENLYLYEQLEDLKLEPEQYVKPSFNKAGRSLNKPAPFEVDHWGINDLMSAYQPTKSEFERYNSMYEEAKAQMIQCPELHQQKKLKHQYGSVSLVSKTPDYDVLTIFKEMGPDILIEYGKPDQTKLDEFILRGTINQKEIDQFKEIVDVRLDFVVMTLESENRMIEMLNKRKLQASQNRMRA